MRQNTIIVATIIRVFALCLAGWALLRFLAWATHPIAARIYTSGHESTGFDFTDIRDLAQIGIYLCLAAAVYAVSVPVGRAATANESASTAFAVAFSSIRTFAFSVGALALLWITFEVLEIPIDHIRRVDESDVRPSMWAGSSFRLRTIFHESVAVLTIFPFWLFARPISHAITRRFQSNEVT